MAMVWWQRRQSPSPAYAGGIGPGGGANLRNGLGFGFGSSSAPVEIRPVDYESFERLLGEIQAAWSNEDVAKLRTLTTPEMVTYFEKDLAANRARNAVNKVSDVKLLQGDLAEAWREGESEYATVAMRFSLVDKTIDRATGRLIEGSEQPVEATEVWTFVRPRGATWELSAIQQTS
jgi:predicted lipid-binding transport protein (Tim44 family)